MSKTIKWLITELKKLDFETLVEKNKKDRQFIAIKELIVYQIFQKYTTISVNTEDINIVNFNKIIAKTLTLIVWNALICYQLSSKWEDYWEEFSQYFIKYWIDIDIAELNSVLFEFISKSKWNKRLINAKQQRLKKINFAEINKIVENILNSSNEEGDSATLETLLNFLSYHLKQKKSAKTLVFAIKMIYYGFLSINEYSTTKVSYWLNKWYNLPDLPYTVLPLDSRILKLLNQINIDPKVAMNMLKVSLPLPLILYDAILWTE